MQGSLVVLNSAQGSPKLDQAASLDFVGIRESMDFLVSVLGRGTAAGLACHLASLSHAFSGFCSVGLHLMCEIAYAFAAYGASCERLKMDPLTVNTTVQSKL